MIVIVPAEIKLGIFASATISTFALRIDVYLPYSMQSLYCIYIYFSTDIRKHCDSNDEDDENTAMIIFIASQLARRRVVCDEFSWL